ncbi:unnamed protein product [Cylindrotheca closterium]|uniref:PAS domain-containing protein n=1 Tax=Cylindrotheca closterium TaxID=2856 RepID=A0AAD2GBN7_9STRA|nr:unnamed protein product [Cylindrotheca closterium]
MMSGGDRSRGDGETSCPSPARSTMAAHMVTTAQSHSPFASGHQFLNAQQNSHVFDPAVVNAAATIAVATAQAVHQANNVFGRQTAAPSMTSALGDNRSQLMGRQAPMPTMAQIAAMLSSGGMQAPFNSNQSSLQQFMNLGGSLGGSMQSSQSHSQGQAQQGALQTASTVAPSATVTSAQAQNMQSWSAEQLEKHVALLHQLNRPVPQYVGLLLTEARRKQKKKNAKRIANRRSASTSRARKKQYVEEMKVTNARLKRQALILSLLPDLVVAITTEGEITFCSAQVERILKHKNDDLIGAKLGNLLVPASRDDLRSLISDMVTCEKEQSHGSAQRAGVGLESKHRRRRGEKRVLGVDTDRTKAVAGNGDGNGSGRSSENTGSAAIVSDQSFPLSVVEVDSKQSGRPDRLNTERTERSNENSDDSTNNSAGKAQLSSLTTSITSPAVSSGDEKAVRQGGSHGSNDSSANAKRGTSSDDSSSLSSDAKNMSEANENLSRNVRRHNQKMEENKKKGRTYGPKDDVTGASVTANNATARLSSLKHVPDFSKIKSEKAAAYENNGDQSSSDESLLAGVEEKKKTTENASDDSGYRESNDSREEMSSSGSDTSNSNEQTKKSLSSTFRMCLIRQDLTTVWCEVTSSVRARMTGEDSFDSPSDPSEGHQDLAPTTAPSTTPPREDQLEILLCLRPIRNGEKNADESQRFVPVQRADYAMDDADTLERFVSSSSENVKKMEGSLESGSRNNPSLKRAVPTEEYNVKQNKKQKTAGKDKPSTLDTEQAVETLMFLNKSSQ